MFSLRGLTIYYAKSGRRTSAVRGFSWRSRRRDWLFEGKCGSVQQSITVWQPERKRTGGVLRLRLALMRQAVGIVRRTSSDGVCRTMSNPEQPVDFIVPVLEPNGAEYSDRHSMRIQREHAQVILVSIPALVNYLSNYRGSRKRGLRILILRLRPGARVGIAVENGQLVVEPLKRHRYTPDELLVQCDPKASRTKAEREWLRNKPAGGELI